MTGVEVYVLKDEEGNYVEVNSIYYEREIRNYKYSSSKFVVNGFYTNVYENESKAKEELNKLINKAKKISLNKKFYIKKIDLVKEMYEESKIKIPKYPIISRVIDKKEVAIA